MAWRLLELFELGAEIRIWSVDQLTGPNERFPSGKKGSFATYCHQKSIIIDCALALFGSQNWSSNSADDCAEMTCLTQHLGTVAAIYAERYRLYG